MYLSTSKSNARPTAKEKRAGVEERLGRQWREGREGREKMAGWPCQITRLVLPLLFPNPKTPWYRVWGVGLGWDPGLLVL
jgi:hypothetical protein